MYGIVTFWGGWFLKTALIWRRDARKAEARQELPPAPARPAPQPHVAPAMENRLERLVDLVNRRLEAIEDRMDFAERLLDSRSPRLERGEAGRQITPQPLAGNDAMKR
jgi:hypothetical protein